MNQYDQFTEEYVVMRSNMFKKEMNAELPVMLKLMNDIKNKKLFAGLIVPLLINKSIKINIKVF